MPGSVMAVVTKNLFRMSYSFFTAGIPAASGLGSPAESSM
jgi:hypothetical protein